MYWFGGIYVPSFNERGYFGSQVLMFAPPVKVYPGSQTYVELYKMPAGFSLTFVLIEPCLGLNNGGHCSKVNKCKSNQV